MTQRPRWSNLSTVAQRFWAVAIVTTLLGPFLRLQIPGQPAILAVTTGSLALLVALTWLGEASDVHGWPVRLITLAAGAGFSASLLPWSGLLVAWLVVLIFAAVAIEDRKPTTAAPVANAESNEAAPLEQVLAEAADEEDDPSVIATQTRRVCDGAESVEGLIVAASALPTHVVFHPPLSKTPEVELYALDDCEPRLAEATPYGFRILTNRAGRVAFSATAPAA